MAEKAPMPPWWVERDKYSDGTIGWVIYGGSHGRPVYICHFAESQYSNARELADLIVQRTKQ